ncbi:MAG TPA: hypothetical protein VF680_01720 [Allosphingosinicella sp.]
MADAIAPAAAGLTVRDLDHLSYPEKIRHWMREDAWNPGGIQLRFKNPAIDGFQAVMDRGHVTFQTLLVGRPCFGILTAFLRYKDETKFVKGRGIQPASRCGTCKLRAHCERVVRNRIWASPVLKAAYNEWLLAEGPASFAMAGWRGSSAHRSWGQLCRVAFETVFTSVNDSAVVEQYRRMDEAAQATDRLRKQRSRERRRRAGILDAGHLFDIQVGAACRMDDLVEAITDDSAPKYLRQLPVKSLIEMMEVWVCREFLAAGMSKVTAPAIARLIERWNWQNDSTTVAALSTRVSKDLARIERFEKMPWMGWVLLPRFDPRAETSWALATLCDTPLSFRSTG